MSNGTHPRPHRGTLILVLGIVGLVLGCLPAGIVAWVMGHSDLKAMQAGELDPDGRGMTNAGRILGIISVVLGLLWLVLVFAFGGLAIIAGALSAGQGG